MDKQLKTLLLDGLGGFDISIAAWDRIEELVEEVANTWYEKGYDSGFNEGKESMTNLLDPEEKDEYSADESEILFGGNE